MYDNPDQDYVSNGLDEYNDDEMDDNNNDWL